ncbi:MAG: hypothetical protein Q7W30_07350 [Coriobacteriia bacterium]|nr:hypothetical protein [Coriobacteriia bacterium]
MTPEPTGPPVDPITLDDLRHKAMRIRDEVKGETKRVVDQRRTQLMLAGVVVIAVAFGVAYFMGTRSGRASVEPAPPTV